MLDLRRGEESQDHHRQTESRDKFPRRAPELIARLFLPESWPAERAADPGRKIWWGLLRQRQRCQCPTDKLGRRPCLPTRAAGFQMPLVVSSNPQPSGERGRIKPSLDVSALAHFSPRVLPQTGEGAERLTASVIEYAQHSGIVSDNNRFGPLVPHRRKNLPRPRNRTDLTCIVPPNLINPSQAELKTSLHSLTNLQDNVEVCGRYAVRRSLLCGNFSLACGVLYPPGTSASIPS